MRRERSHPSWWQLYLLVPGTIGLLVLGALAPLSGRGHQTAEIGTLLLVWGLVELWLRANTPALLRVDKRLLAQQARPSLVREMSEDECLPVVICRRQPEEADAQPPAETVPALQEGNE